MLTDFLRFVNIKSARIESWHLVKNASKVTGFVGGKVRPPEVPEAEVLRVTQQMELG